MDADHSCVLCAVFSLVCDTTPAGVLRVTVNHTDAYLCPDAPTAFHAGQTLAWSWDAAYRLTGLRVDDTWYAVVPVGKEH